MTARNPVLAPWETTGRFIGPPQRERELDLAAVLADLKAHRPVRPLMERWLVEALEEYVRLRAGGARADLHRLLGLPRPHREKTRRHLVKEARERAIREIAAALPPPPRKSLAFLARQVKALVEDRQREAPAAVRGPVAALRDGLYGEPPTSEKTYRRALKLDKSASSLVSITTTHVQSHHKGRL